MSRKRDGATVGKVLALAGASVLLLCAAGNVPVENFTPQGPMGADLNAGGHAITNAASVSATTVTAGTISGAATNQFEAALGHPAADGEVLQSTAAGARSWSVPTGLTFQTAGQGLGQILKPGVWLWHNPGNEYGYTLPSSPNDGDTCVVADPGANFGTTPTYVSPATYSQLIDNLAGGPACTQDNTAYVFRYNAGSSSWHMQSLSLVSRNSLIGWTVSDAATSDSLAVGQNAVGDVGFAGPLLLPSKAGLTAGALCVVWIYDNSAPDGLELTDLDGDDLLDSSLADTGSSTLAVGSSVYTGVAPYPLVIFQLVYNPVSLASQWEVFPVQTRLP